MKRNLKKVYKLPTKKQETDFIKNLKPFEKEYTIFNCKKNWFNDSNWNGIVYYKWWEVVLLKIIKKVNALRTDIYSRVDKK